MPPTSSDDHFRIHLSLISHTNIGKTTLARTLLMKDVGAVADRAHVTETTDDYLLARDNAGGELILWDTPGFGDSVRLAKRLSQREKPLGWFLTEVWDRFANKTFWLNQQALRHIRDTSDVILYLINANAKPEDARYLEAELKIFSWMDKPVLVLLNQLGEPKSQKEEAEIIAFWTQHFSHHEVVKAVLPLDAFARCWIQERALFEAIGKALPANLQPSYSSLSDVWIRARRAIYQRSLDMMADHLSLLTESAQTAQAPTLKEHLVQFGTQLGLFKGESVSLEDAQTALSTQAADQFCALTDRLIKGNHLKGSSVSRVIMKRMKTDWNVATYSFDVGSAAAIGAGVGALGSGIAADIATGGLTLGLGTLVGGIIGAIGGAGFASAYNARHTKEGVELTWSAEALNGFLLETLLLYLAVSHFGRGRGEWKGAESPEFWKTEVEEAIKAQPIDWDVLRTTNQDETKARLTQSLDELLRRIFQDLYGMTP